MKKYLGMQKNLKSIIKTLHSDGTYKQERIITTPQSNIISTNKFKNVLNFCSNNYLGLCDNPEIIQTAKTLLDERGFGLSSVRFICGTTDHHKSLESRISNFYEQEDTILFPSCFDANEAIFEALLNSEDAIITDQLNHASIISGIRLTKCTKKIYSHNNMKELEKALIETQNNRFRMIVTDGVFSMDGAIANLKAICDLADKYNAIVMVDECHGSGVLGDKGRGAVEITDTLDRVDVISSTLGKALGGANGGFITGRSEIVEVLRQKGKPYLFSNSLPTFLVGAYEKAFDVLEGHPEKLRDLRRNIKNFRGKMKGLGFDVLGDDMSAICPVLLKDARLARDFADKLLEHGVYVIGFSYPVVAKGLARIRVQLSAGHTVEDVDYCVEAFEKVGREMKVI